MITLLKQPVADGLVHKSSVEVALLVAGVAPWQVKLKAISKKPRMHRLLFEFDDMLNSIHNIHIHCLEDYKANPPSLLLRSDVIYSRSIPS